MSAFGAEYRSGSTALTILSLSAIAMVLNNLLQSALVSMGYAWGVSPWTPFGRFARAAILVVDTTFPGEWHGVGEPRRIYRGYCATVLVRAAVFAATKRAIDL
jgi:hypothetical protein